MLRVHHKWCHPNLLSVKPWFPILHLGYTDNRYPTTLPYTLPLVQQTIVLPVIHRPRNESHECRAWSFRPTFRGHLPPASATTRHRRVIVRKGIVLRVDSAPNGRQPDRCLR